MKKIFILIKILSLFIYGSILEKEEVKTQMMEDYFKDNTKLPISTLNYKVKNIEIFSKIDKEIMGKLFNIKAILIINNSKHELYQNKNLNGQGSGFFQVACTKGNSLILSITHYSFNQEAEFNGIFYKNNLYKIEDNSVKEETIYNKLTGEYKYGLGGYLYEPSDNTTYKYFTPKKLLTHLYEIGLCDKQESDSKYYFDLIYIISSKSYFYKTPSEESITKMYLIAGDKADFLEEKIDENGIKWYNILYHGRKDINAWIKADESVNLDSEDK